MRPRSHILKPPARPLIADDAGTVAHVWFRNGALVDKYGNAWTQNGAVPQVAKSGRTPAGAGPFSDANYYSLGTGNDALDFVGDFSIAVVFQPTATNNSGAFLSNGVFGAAGSGYRLSLIGGVGQIDTYAAASGLGRKAEVAAVQTGTLNVICAGRGTTTVYLKQNLRAILSAAAATITAGTGRVANLGRDDGLTNSVPGNIYEIWMSSTTPSDALFIDIMNRVKARVGITAW